MQLAATGTKRCASEKPEGSALPVIPDAEEFRAWLLVSLDLIDVRPAAASRAAEIGPNAVKKFLDRVNADMRLNSASSVASWVVSTACEKGVALPPCPLPIEQVG